MEHEPALDRLPPAHAVALRALERGMCTEDVAALLGIEPEAVAPLVEVARQKLRALETEQA